MAKIKRTNLLTTTQFAKRIGVHPCTLRRWDDEGLLKPQSRTNHGDRYYSEKQVEDYLNEYGNNKEE